MDEHENKSGDFHIFNLTEASGPPKAAVEMLRSLQGPETVDQMLRTAVSMCWILLPDDRKNVDAVEHEIRRLVDRIIANLREDAKAFGISEHD
jgi:hypothetical protein